MTRAPSVKRFCAAWAQRRREGSRLAARHLWTPAGRLP